MGKRGSAAAHRAAQGPDVLERPVLDLATHAGKLGLSNGLKLAAQGKRQHHAGETHALEGLVGLALLFDDVVGDCLDPTLGVLPRQVDGLGLDDFGPTQALEVAAGVLGERALLDEIRGDLAGASSKATSVNGGGHLAQERLAGPVPLEQLFLAGQRRGVDCLTCSVGMALLNLPDALEELQARHVVGRRRGTVRLDDRLNLLQVHGSQSFPFAGQHRVSFCSPADCNENRPPTNARRRAACAVRGAGALVGTPRLRGGTYRLQAHRSNRCITRGASRRCSRRSQSARVPSGPSGTEPRTR